MGSSVCGALRAVRNPLESVVSKGSAKSQVYMLVSEEALE